MSDTDKTGIDNQAQVEAQAQVGEMNAGEATAQAAAEANAAGASAHQTPFDEADLANQEVGVGAGGATGTPVTSFGDHLVDPVSIPSVLQHAMSMFDIVNFDALQVEPRLKGVVNKNPKTAAIILAGGQGERFGHEGGKQLVTIAGKPILTRSAEVFDAVGDVGLIVIVCPKERTEEYKAKAIDPYPFVTPIVMAPAGSIRQESAFSGLELVPESYEYVMLHDGARPLVTKELIEHTINTLKGNIDCDGVLVGHPSIDTLKVVENGVVVGTPDRSVFWNAQTPQVFRAGIYRRAHASALSDGFVGTDDSSLIERLGGRVLVVEGKRDNIKLTVPEDYLLMTAAIKAAIEERRARKEAGSDDGEFQEDGE